MKSFFKFFFVLLVAAVIGGLGYYYGRSSMSEDNHSATAVAPSGPTTTLSQEEMAAQADDQSGGQNDKDQASDDSGKPELVIPEGKSFEDVLSDFFGKDVFTSLFKSDDLERRVVTSVDNAIGEVQPTDKISPLNGPESEFVVAKAGDKTVIDPANYKRYDVYVDLLRKTDMKQMADIYVHFYSALQSAYQELGTQKEFKDRTLAVINKLLKTPEESKPIAVFRPTPHGKYLFVEDRLENLTPAQKILVRMGPDNERVVKAKLRQFRHDVLHFRK
jgi:hypothetical protein